MKHLITLAKGIKRYNSSSTISLYETLGVKPGATPEEIKAGYKKRIKALHPDVCRDYNDVAFKQVIEAYKTLSDPFRKDYYDVNGDSEKPNAFIRPKRKFYENKWYNYTKPADDLRFEYDIDENEDGLFQKFINSVRGKIFVLATILVGFQIWEIYRRNSLKDFLNWKKELGNTANKSPMTRYIYERETVHKTETD